MIRRLLLLPLLVPATITPVYLNPSPPRHPPSRARKGRERSVRGAPALRKRNLREGPPVGSTPEATFVAPEEKGTLRGREGGGSGSGGRRPAAERRRE